MIMRSARYLLAKLLFLVMGLRVSRYRAEVENLWSLSEEARSQALDKLLAMNRPINSKGVEVKGLEALTASPPMSKKQLSSQSAKEQGNNDPMRFGRHTAGTTGEPTHVALNREELARMLGVRDYCFRHYGVKLGQREARLWGRPEPGIKSRLKNFVMNRRVFHPVGPESRNELADLLNWRPDYLYGYASLLLEAAKILESMDLKFEPPKLVVSTAESILPTQKAYISQAFGAPVAEEYGSTEFDIIAFECRAGHRHLVNPWLIIEKGDDSCFISDVSRRTQSLIRYRLGDSLSISKYSCQKLGSNDVIERLEGRTLDRFFYVNERKKVHATIFPSLFEKYFSERIDIFGFTVVQVGFSEIKVFVKGLEKSNRDDLQYFLERELTDRLSIDVNVEVVVTNDKDEIVKRNYFVQKIPDLL